MEVMDDFSHRKKVEFTRIKSFPFFQGVSEWWGGFFYVPIIASSMNSSREDYARESWTSKGQPPWVSVLGLGVLKVRHLYPPWNEVNLFWTGKRTKCSYWRKQEREGTRWEGRWGGQNRAMMGSMWILPITLNHLGSFYSTKDSLNRLLAVFYYSLHDAGGLVFLGALVLRNKNNVLRNKSRCRMLCHIVVGPSKVVLNAFWFDFEFKILIVLLKFRKISGNDKSVLSFSELGWFWIRTF